MPYQRVVLAVLGFSFVFSIGLVIWRVRGGKFEYEQTRRKLRALLRPMLESSDVKWFDISIGYGYAQTNVFCSGGTEPLASLQTRLQDAVKRAGIDSDVYVSEREPPAAGSLRAEFHDRRKT